MAQSARCTKSGFTLIELSIVIVIIGLIAGGVLVGQDMIRAAEIRATISQIEKYNSAVNTFRGKYNNQLPGDLQYQQANAFGFFAFSDAGAGGMGEGDGNGLIENTNGAGAYLFGTSIAQAPSDVQHANGEQFVFWLHLSQANLIDGNFGNGLGTNGSVQNTTNDPSQYFPPAKLGHGMYFVVASDGAYNYFGLAALAGVETDQLWVSPPWTEGTPSHGLTPLDAYAIDVKLDDGMPNTGSVHAMSIELYNGFGGSAWWTSPPVSGQGICITGGGNGFDSIAIYNTDQAKGGNEPACDMEFRFN